MLPGALNKQHLMIKEMIVYTSKGKGSSNWSLQMKKTQSLSQTFLGV
jgi:hypothetical protein